VNYKIFQDNPDQARTKIYGSNNVALSTDSSGRLTVTAPGEGLSITAPANGLTITAPASGLSITPPSGGLSITPPSGGLSITSPANGLTVTAPASGLSITPPAGGLSITPPTGGLSITPPTGGLSVTSPANGLTVTAPASGLSITPPTGGLSITPPSGGLSVTSPTNGLTVTAPASGLSITPPTDGLLITSTGLATALATTDVSATRANFTDTGGTPDTTYTVLGVKTWTFGVVNAALATNAQALVKLQMSADGSTWNDEVANTTISQNSMQTFVSSIFLKYARVYYAAVNASSAVTLRIYLQGQT